MSTEFWADDTDEVDETNAMRVLREKAEADSKVIREMADRLAKMEAKEARSSLEDSLKAKGLDPKVADLIPKDTDPEKFLADYGALLVRASTEGSEESGGEAEGEPEGEVSADEAAARAAIANAASGAQPKAGLDSVAAKLQPGAFDNAEDLLAFLQSQ
jgi:hypothetical protein